MNKVTAQQKANKQLVTRVIAYLNKITKSNYKTDTANTIRNIKHGSISGYTWEDFKYVVDVKCVEWKGTKFAKYLRPSTLFRPANFEDYRNQKNESEVDLSDKKEYTIVWEDNPNGHGRIGKKIYKE